jgi:hypothetical protein
MKKLLIIALAVMAGMSSIGFSQIPATLPQAESLAAAQGKLVLVDFFTVW